MFCAYGCAPCRKCPLSSPSISIPHIHNFSSPALSPSPLSLYSHRGGFFFPPLIFSVWKQSCLSTEGRISTWYSWAVDVSYQDTVVIQVFLFMLFCHLFIFIHSFLLDWTVGCSLRETCTVWCDMVWDQLFGFSGTIFVPLDLICGASWSLSLLCFFN